MTSQVDTDTITKTTIKVTQPSLYKVILLNDDYTPMEFVVKILVEFFSKSIEEATEIMMMIHVNGRGVAGEYIKEIAEQKADDVCRVARKHGHPLKAIIERG